MTGFEDIVLTPACGTSVLGNRRMPSPERIHRALADMEQLMPAFEAGSPAAPAPGLDNARTLNNEPSWAPRSPAPGM